MRRDLEQDVVFRVWRARPRTVIALWPAVFANNSGTHCQSFEHIGQHGGADYQHILRLTRPAKPGEYATLLAELRSMGHSGLRVIQRAQRRHDDYRRKASVL